MTPLRTRRHALAVAALLTSLAYGSRAHGQSLSSLRIGDPAARLSSLGQPKDTESNKGLTVRRWVLPSGNDLSVTTNDAGRIVYLEVDWNGTAEDAACDLPGLRFGKTTLAELRGRFGSNGFAFKGQSGQLLTQDGAVLVNSYEANGAVVTFYNKVSNARAAQLNPEGSGTFADNARLDAITIAAPDYAQQEWGDRVYDPQYKKIAWK